MKNKNPLYFVKGQDVIAADTLLDLLIKKFNLTPVIEFMKTYLKILLEMVKDYPTLKMVNELLAEFLKTIEPYLTALRSFSKAESSVETVS